MSTILLAQMCFQMSDKNSPNCPSLRYFPIKCKLSLSGFVCVCLLKKHLGQDKGDGGWEFMQLAETPHPPPPPPAFGLIYEGAIGSAKIDDISFPLPPSWVELSVQYLYQPVRYWVVLAAHLTPLESWSWLEEGCSSMLLKQSVI